VSFKFAAGPRLPIDAAGTSILQALFVHARDLFA